MKATKISITGMHKVKFAEYNLDDKLTYFIGENGAGKSTVLQAIQLALLGYIPGYAKTNEGIMKHACAPMLCVCLELDSGIKITRTWMKKGASVKSEVNVEGYEGELSDLLGEVELPIFNFNEFKSMTANKLKEWFITFLPTAETDIDVESILINDEKVMGLLTDDLKARLHAWMGENSANSVEGVKQLNTWLKEEQSFVKGQISKLQGTIESLVRYDDVPDYDKDEITLKISELTQMKDQCIKYDSFSNRRNELEVQVKEIEESLQGTGVDDDCRVVEAKAQIAEYESKLKTSQEELDQIMQKHAQLSAELAKLSNIRSNICPYTKQACESIGKTMEESQKKAEELKPQLEECTKQISELRVNQQKYNSYISASNDNLIYISNQYNKYASRKAEYDDLVNSIGERPTDKTVTELNSELMSLQDTLAKIVANEKYDQLTEDVTKDKFANETELEVLKIWIKITDANGLQTDLMNEPFKNLAESMSNYLSKMFGKDTIAHFNLISKANSFSFGVSRDNSYIEFDYLSSGEKCLFTLALAMCILEKSKSEIHTILIDDILDHLDTKNASHLFNTLKSVDNIQFILAGVQECEDASICHLIQ